VTTPQRTERRAVMRELAFRSAFVIAMLASLFIYSLVV
jgi:hypothetical protein